VNAELVFFGRSISMAQQSRRRILVAIIYCILGSILVGSYVFGTWRTISPYVIWPVIFACRLFLGGYAYGGVVKPFNGKAPNRFEAPPPLLALKLRVYRPLPGDGSSLFRNDEREMSQRDRAHYLAYQAIGISLIVPWAAASLLGDPKLFGWNPASINHLCAALLLAVLTLFLTLPQSILLWTEPDMEEP
jgi:hypothetical protein